jgi:hypothetical protein
MGSGSVAPHILNLDTRWLLYPCGKSKLLHPLDRRLMGLGSSLNMMVKEKNSCPYQKLKPVFSAHSLVTVWTDLLWHNLKNIQCVHMLDDLQGYFCFF